MSKPKVVRPRMFKPSFSYVREGADSIMFATHLRDLYNLFYNWCMNVSMLDECVNRFVISRVVEPGFGESASKAFSYLGNVLPPICHEFARAVDFAEVNGVDHSVYNRKQFRARIKIDKLKNGLYVLTLEDTAHHIHTLTIPAYNCMEALWRFMPVVDSILGKCVRINITNLVNRHGSTTHHRNTARTTGINRKKIRRESRM